ncbi:MAG: TlpA disulfide reductase family protein [Sedimentisphaerales bacterium]
METEKANKNSILSPLVIVLLIAALAAIGVQLFKNRSGNAANLIGTMALPIQVDQWITPQPPDLNGRVYVLEFWATWCPPCVQSIPHMIELANKYKDKAVPFIALSVDRSSEPVKKMVKARSINYYVGMDNGLSDKYSVSGIPAAFIIGRSGQVVWMGHPMSSGFEPAIADALNGPPPEPQKNTK